MTKLILLLLFLLILASCQEESSIAPIHPDTPEYPQLPEFYGYNVDSAGGVIFLQKNPEYRFSRIINTNDFAVQIERYRRKSIKDTLEFIYKFELKSGGRVGQINIDNLMAFYIVHADTLLEIYQGQK